MLSLILVGGFVLYVGLSVAILLVARAVDDLRGRVSRLERHHPTIARERAIKLKGFYIDRNR